MATHKSRDRALRLWIWSITLVAACVLGTWVANDSLPYLVHTNCHRALSDISAIRTAVETYAIENGGWPPARLEELISPDADGRTYLTGCTSVPLDPWKRPYVYVPPAPDSEYDIRTLGRDGLAGGRGEDEDLGRARLREQRGRD